jgi:hypothetical protein
MRRVLFFLVLVAALALIAVPQAFASALVVDKDKVQCPKATFTSIQAAVNAAVPGDTIKVCADQYNESVTVNKPSLKLLGTSDVPDCTVLSAADPTKDAIVTGGSFSFSLTNNNITLSGFVVQGASGIGIRTSDAFSGYQITGNTAQNNGLDGINFNSGGTNQSRVDHNCFRTNGRDGLASEIGNLRNALVDHNATYRNPGGGLDFTGAGARAYVTVTRNLGVENGFSSYSLDNSIGSSIIDNVSRGTPTSNIQGAGIDLGGANNGLEISHNTVDGGIGNGIRFDVNIFIPVFPAPSVGLNVSSNTVTHSGGSGIIAIGPTAANTGSVTLSLFSGNDSSLNGLDGFRIEAFNNNNRFVNNDADKNGRDGIHNETATGNTFESNHMFLNVEFDARDDNRPANTWTHNSCDTDSPPGTICGVG